MSKVALSKLADAIVVLDRSIKNFVRYGWTTGVFGDVSEPKCAVGAMTDVVGSHPTCFMDAVTEGTYAADLLQTASYALYRTLTPEQNVELVAAAKKLDVQNGDKFGDLSASVMRVQQGGWWTFQDIENVVVLANDKVMKNDVEVRQWFSDAIDVLSQDLPLPVAADLIDEVRPRQLVTA